MNHSRNKNSWYQILKIIIDKTAAVDSYIKKWFQILKDDFLIPQNWEKLHIILHFLQSFHRATIETEGDYITINRVLFIIDILIKYFEKSLYFFKPDSYLSTQVKKNWTIFDKYYNKSDNSPSYIAAIILNPSRRTQYIRHNWKKE
jgi:hypothetical protein